MTSFLTITFTFTQTKIHSKTVISYLHVKPLHYVRLKDIILYKSGLQERAAYILQQAYG